VKLIRHLAGHLGLKESVVTDHWYRYKWQSRGSGHVHGFLWLSDAPDIDKLDFNDDIAVRNAKQYYDQFINGYNPAVDAPRPLHDCLERPLCALEPGDLNDYGEICNRCMLHGKRVNELIILESSELMLTVLTKVNVSA
jgi:hypothetical protein